MLELFWLLSSCVLIFFILIRVPESEVSGIEELGFNFNSSSSKISIFEDPIDIFIWIVLFLLFLLTSLFVLFVV